MLSALTLLSLFAAGPALDAGHLVAPGEKLSLPLPDLRRGEVYSVVVSLPRLAELGEGDAIELAVHDALGPLATKTLHAGDPDLAVNIRVRADGPGTVEAQARAPGQSGQSGKSHPLEVRLARLELSGKAGALVAANPSSDWREAQPMELGKPLFALGDERPFIPLHGDPARGFQDMLAGVQWFTFTWPGPGRTLVHFSADVLDRDVPLDVAVFRREGEGAAARLVPYREGIERFVPELSTSFHGLYKFTPRVLEPGPYWVRVMGNHPAYVLRTELYPPPPYDDPRLAVRAGADYLLRKGDSWHANTPRRGHAALRNTSPLQETSLCIACHPTHFTTRGALVAAENGYPVRARPELLFLTERLYQNPRPLYGLPETSWARMISAAGNVLSRLAYMEVLFERHVSGETRHGLLESIGSFLEKYWAGVKEPITESNGNEPRVSGFEVALHSALVFEELHDRTRDPRWQRLRDQVEEVVTTGPVLDMIDLCWKTVALATLDPVRYETRIYDLAKVILAEQREDGSWSVVLGNSYYRFDYTSQRKSASKDFRKDEKGRPVSSEFQTWHCLYALARAGLTDADPRVAKAVRYCLSRQWSHGGWQGNADYKNFDTTFRDTQYAVMALSELYKGSGSRGWDAGFAPPPTSFPDETDEALAALDRSWSPPGPAALERIRAYLKHPQPLVRQAACAALGRFADTGSTPLLAEALGDPSKVVRHGAAWALRQIAGRRAKGADFILLALRSSDDRTREGALRVFARDFRYLAERWELARELLTRLREDPVVLVRLGAAQAAWRWWYWVAEDERRSALEEAVIAGLGRTEHPWVRRGLMECLYNMIDDNETYLFTSWIPALKREEDRTRVDGAWRAKALAQAKRMAQVLQSGSDLARDGVLRALYTFHLRESGGDLAPTARVAVPETLDGPWLEGYRRAIAYDPLRMGTGVLARIGNDREAPVFYPDSGPVLAGAFLRILEEPETRLAGGALRALRHAGGVPVTAELAVKALRLAGSAPPGARAEVVEAARALLPGKIPHDEAVAQELEALLGAGTADGLAAAILEDPRNQPLGAKEGVAAALAGRVLALGGDEPAAPDLIAALGRSLRAQETAGVAARLVRIAREGAPAAREAALRSMLGSPRLLAGGPARKRFDEEMAAATPERLSAALQVLLKMDWSKLEEGLPRSLALGLVSLGLAQPPGETMTLALEAVRVVPGLAKNEGILAPVRSLAAGSGGPARDAARSLLESISGKAGAQKREPPDYEFFARKVNPLLVAAGEDGESCAQCHANHVVLRLTPPPEARDAEALARANYVSALKAVDLERPEESLILVKPRQSSEKIGVPGEYRNSHGGGARWPRGKDSEEYRAVLEWIRGARLPAPAAAVPVSGSRLVREF